MGHVSFLAEKSFRKIFTNLAKEVNQKVEDIMIGICYESGNHKYIAYVKDGGSFKPVLDAEGKVRSIDLDDYSGMLMDLSGGTAAIDSTIAQSGPRFARELSEKLQKEIKVDDVSILMKYKENDLPFAVLMTNGNEKQRNINIEAEFLQG